jgi:hypothetical protein
LYAVVKEFDSERRKSQAYMIRDYEKEMPVNNSSILMKRGSSRASLERYCELIRSAGHKNFI